MIRAAILLLVLGFSSLANAAPHTPQELLRAGDVRAITISPDGKHVAIGITGARGHADSIAVVEVDRLGEPDATRRFDLGADGTAVRIMSLRWFNNSRLLAELASELKERPQAVWTVYGIYSRVLNPGRLHSIDAVGDGAAVTFDERFRADSIQADPAPAGDSVVIKAYEEREVSLGDGNLYRVNVNTGAPELLEKDNQLTCCWVVRGGRAVVKINYLKYRGVYNVFTRSEFSDAAWTYLGAFDYRQWQSMDRRFVAEARSPTEIYVRAPRNGGDTDGIQLFDIAAGKIVSTLTEVPGYDVESALVSKHEFVAASYVDDRITQVFPDPVLNAHYLKLQEYFGPSASVEAVGIDDAHNKLLLHVTGPQRPGEYHIYDVGSHHAGLVITERPWIDPTRLAVMTVRHVKTRDGTVISAYLTCPQSSTDSPVALVVMPPAGPWTRGSIRFNRVAQAFASQGWCVLEPNYRGVRGYGRKFQRAGYGQWTGKVAEDIVDAINEAVTAGIADRRRIALYGESLAAYPALQGAIDNPNMYRAVVTQSAMVDFDAMLTELKSHIIYSSAEIDRWSEYRGGEPRVRSPQLQASGIKCPVMLIHVTRGQEVPIEQSKALQKALEKAGNTTSTLWLAHDGTWSADENNEILQVQGAIGFLRPHL